MDNTRGITNRFGCFVEYVQDENKSIEFINFFNENSEKYCSISLKELSDDVYVVSELDENGTGDLNVYDSESHVLLCNCFFLEKDNCSSVWTFLYKNDVIVSREYFSYEDVLHHSEIFVKRDSLVFVVTDIEEQKLYAYEDYRVNSLLFFYQNKYPARVLELIKKMKRIGVDRRIEKSINLKKDRRFYRTSFVQEFRKYLKAND